MKTIAKIIDYIQDHGPVSGNEISKHFGITRQATNKHIKKLLESGIILKSGKTRGALYNIAQEPFQIKALKSLKKIYFLRNIAEDEIFTEFSMLMSLRNNLTKNSYEIVHYAFTEILNNAIEHSQSEKCSINIALDNYNCTFTIRDFGIGIFHSIADKYNLSDEVAATAELTKGKRTTLPERHTGEGIFFTSKVGDEVNFRSHKSNLRFDNQKKDVFLEEKRNISGTEVIFNIKKSSRRKLDAIFHEYAPQDYDYKFEKTKVYVKLFQIDYISRSEAKRLLAGLDSFKEIILDFKGVKSLGQGFADELFRVFNKTHPNIIIKIENLNPILKPIIDHVG